MAKIELKRVEGDFGFEAKDEAGKTMRLDSSPEHGGIGFGVRPMQSVLMALGECSAIDIVSILKKQRQAVDDFAITIEGEREQGKEPSLWIKAHVLYQLKGEIDLDKARKACALSIDKYCSVAETLRRAGCDITWDVKVN